MSEKKAVYPSEELNLAFSLTTIKNCALAWLIPGLGYWLVGRKREALAVGGALFFAILMGIFLQGDFYPFSGEGKLRAIGAVCQLGSGLPYLLINMLFGRGTPLNPTYDYGTNYFLIVGMLNWLAVMDIYDISVKRK